MKMFFYKNGVIRTATKALKQASKIQRNALTSLIHFMQLQSKVNWDVGALHWISEACFSAFCGSQLPHFCIKTFLFTPVGRE